MTKFASLSKKTKKAIVYGVIIGILLIAFLIVRLVMLAEERSRTFIFTAEPSSSGGYQLNYQYGLLEQDDYDSLSIDISGLEYLSFDEVGNPSPQQENSRTSKDYGNLQLDLIYPIGSIYKIEGASVSITDQTIGDTKKYSLTWVDTESHTQTFNAYHELLAYLEPYLYQADQKLSTLSLITDSDHSDSSSIRLLSNGFGLTQYGFPSGCEIIYAQPAASTEGAGQIVPAFNLQELCPPNQAAYYPGLLDPIGYMDKIDFFIKTDDVTRSFPIIIDPNDTYAILTGNNLIQSDEINSYLFIIESASRIHLTAHNNFVRIGAKWSETSNPSEGRLSFPGASLVITNLPGALIYGKENQLIDASSTLKIIAGENVRTSLNAILAGQNGLPSLTRVYIKGLFAEIILNDRTIIKADEDK
jgi:hypothetical protein